MRACHPAFKKTGGSVVRFRRPAPVSKSEAVLTICTPRGNGAPETMPVRVRERLARRVKAEGTKVPTNSSKAADPQ